MDNKRKYKQTQQVALLEDIILQPKHITNKTYEGSIVLTAVVMKSSIFWATTPYKV
jgi:hypothetical protein